MYFRAIMYIMFYIVHTSTATSGSGDYDSIFMSLTYTSGSADGAEMCASINVHSDDLVEFEEEFGVMLTLVTSGPSLGNNKSAVTIIDNDGKCDLTKHVWD
jgi:hypothetical protein